MAYRIYENKTDHLIVFSYQVLVKSERRPCWVTAKPGETVKVDYSDLEKFGPTSYERAEMNGLTLKKGVVQDVEAVKMPPEVLAAWDATKAEMKAPKKKTRKSSKKLK